MPNNKENKLNPFITKNQTDSMPPYPQTQKPIHAKQDNNNMLRPTPFSIEQRQKTRHITHLNSMRADVCNAMQYRIELETSSQKNHR